MNSRNKLFFALNFMAILPVGIHIINITVALLRGHFFQTKAPNIKNNVDKVYFITNNNNNDNNNKYVSINPYS